jgi:hypothetical protein
MARSIDADRNEYRADQRFTKGLRNARAFPDAQANQPPRRLPIAGHFCNFCAIRQGWAGSPTPARRAAIAAPRATRHPLLTGA